MYRREAGGRVAETPAREEMDMSEKLKILPSGNLGPEIIPKLKCNRIFGKYKNPKYLKKAEWWFLFVSFLSLVVSMGFTIHRLVTLPKDSDDYTFTIMLCFTTLVSSYYIISGVLKERWPELLVFIASCFILTCYLAVNVAYSSPIPSMTEKTARLTVGVIFLLFNAALGGRLVYVYIDRREMVCLINCREDMVKGLIWLFCCASLITLDWQLQATMLICALENGTSATQVEIIWIVVGALLATIRIVAGYLSIYKESKPWMTAFYFLWIFNLAYMVFKCARLVSLAPYENWTTLYHASIACISCTLALWLILLFFMVKLAMNFGKGIKDALKRHDAGDERSSGEVTQEEHHLHIVNHQRLEV
ncbi:uncharacterized protein LOC144178932 isoform X3 [Haemaphysalis longicornis]